MEGEIDYEGLPDHAGLGVHMLAGALVSISGDAGSTPILTISIEIHVWIGWNIRTCDNVPS